MATPSTPLVKPTTSLLADWKWLTTHVILLSIVALLVSGGVYGVLNILEKHDAAREAKDQQTQALLVKQSQDLTARLQADEAAATADRAASAARDAQQTAVIQTLANTIKARDAALAATLKQNATLSAQQAALKLAAQTKAGPGEITASGDTVTMDLPVARSVVSMGDNLVAAQADLADTKKQLDATNVKLADALKNDENDKKDLDDAKKVIAAKDEELKGATKVCNDKLSTQAGKYRKRMVVVAVLAYLGGILTNPLKGL
jgi:hypothetical protein